MARSGWKALSGGLGRFLSSHRKDPDGAHQEAPRILAIVPHGPNRLLIRALALDAGWAVTLSETLPSLISGRHGDIPPIIIYDRELAPSGWREVVGVLTKISPRPYVILLSGNADANLWDELQRAGGSDLLRTPVSRDDMLWAVRRAWRLWRNLEQVRSPSPG